jgi:hypothetical protein
MLNTHNLNIAKLAPKEDSRFTLSGILVTPECTVETDGEQLVIVSRPTTHKASDFPTGPITDATPVNTHPAFIMSTADADAIAKYLKTTKRSTLPILTNAAVCAEHTIANGQRYIPVLTANLDSTQTHQVRAIAGSFPNYERAMKPASEQKGFKIVLDARQLKSLMMQFESFMADKLQRNVEFYFDTETSAVRMDADGGDSQHMTAFLMPESGEPFSQLERENAA